MDVDIRDTMSTLGGYHEYIGGYHKYIGGYHKYIKGYSVHWGDIMSTLGVFSTLGGYHEHMGDIQNIGVFNRN